MEFLKSLGTTVPPWLVLAAGLAVGVLLFTWPRTRRFARRWLLFVTGTYLALGLPAVANAIVGRLPAVETTRPESVRTLIVLDGDNRRGRLRETLSVLERDRPSAVWVLGDVWFIDELDLEGYPREMFQHETESSTTREQLAWVNQYVGRSHDRPTLVVSRLQAPRVAALLRALNLQADLLVSPIDDEPPTTGWTRWVPSYVALRASRDAIYEHVALFYYRWKGWIES
jgi:hypothetical protein